MGSYDMNLYQLLIRPSEVVCNRLGLTDEHERGMMRMLVNMCAISCLAVPIFYVLWKVLA